MNLYRHLAILAMTTLTSMLSSSAKSTIPYSEAYISADSTYIYQIDREYDQYKRPIRLTYNYLIRNGYPENTLISQTTEFKDTIPGIWKEYVLNILNTNDGNQIIKMERDFDRDMRTIRTRQINNDTVLYIKEYDYNVYPQGAHVGYAANIINPATGEIISTLGKEKYVWCEGAQSFKRERDSEIISEKVYPDSVVRIENNNKHISYYKDGKEIGWLNIQKLNDTEISAYGQVSYQKTDSTLRTITKYAYSFDSESRKWKGLSKSIESFDNKTYNRKGFYESYNWDEATDNWKLSSRTDYSWLAPNWRKGVGKNADGTTSTSYSLFEDDKYIRDATKLSEDLYYVEIESKPDNCTYYTYYGSNGSVRRRIKADHTYYFIDRFFEYKYGEWMPCTETVTLLNGSKQFVYTSFFENGIPRGINETYFSTSENRWRTSHYIVYFQPDDKYEGKFPLGYVYREVYSNSEKELERGSLKMLNDHVVAKEIEKSNYYYEYDMKHYVALNYQKEANQFVYSYCTYPKCISGEYAEGDTTVYLTPKYDHNSGIMTIDRRKQAGKKDDYNYEMRETYDFTLSRYIPVSERIEYTRPEPGWQDFKVSEELMPQVSSAFTADFTIGFKYFDNVLSNTAESPVSMSDLGHYKEERISTYDTYEAKSYNPIEGIWEETAYTRVEFDTTPERCARITTEHNQGTTNVTEQICEKTPSGYISAFIVKYNGEVRYATYYDYDSDDRLIQIRNSQFTHRFWYEPGKDLINDFTNIEATIVHEPEFTYTINGLTVNSDSNELLELYSLDGRAACPAASRCIIAPKPGLYILRIGDNAAKISIR